MDISSLGWDLAELETAAQLVLEEEEHPCASEEHQNTLVNPFRAEDNHTPPTGDTTLFIGPTSHSEEGLDEDLARRMTLRSPSCLIEEISTSQTEGSSEDSSESGDSQYETSSESESSESENPSEDNSFDGSGQSPPLQPTATNQELVESGKGIIQTSPQHPSVLPSTEHIQ